MTKKIKFIKKYRWYNFPKYLKLRKEYNSLELKYEMLEEDIRTELYKTMIKKLPENAAIIKKDKEIKQLRLKIKELKNEIQFRDASNIKKRKKKLK